ncbi:MAG: thiamine-phosphate kinase [Burkholderiaceae bacterium]|nr:thiamine-phosphate kinase [Burkholderiaceae bacterium]
MGGARSDRPATSAKRAAIGEFELIRRFFDRGPARRVELGIGDDCALIAPRAGRTMAVSTDMLVSGRHFLPDADPRSLGHKALAVNLSDLAAMGADPYAFTLAIALARVDERWLEGFASGLFEIADRFRCELIGGDTTAGPLTISITVLGDLPGAVALRRDRAEPGDDLWLSGEIGGAAYALHRRLAGDALAPDDPSALRLDRPEPRVALGIGLRHLARAAIDLSDGLIGDLGHICERSRVGARIELARLPIAAALARSPAVDPVREALAGGDDYELLFCAAAEDRTAISALGSSLSLPLTRIGAIVAGQGIVLHDARGAPVAIDTKGFDHFG